MSLRDKIRTGLGFVLILSLWGCENPNEIGLLELPPDTSRVKVYYKEFNLPVSVIQNDSVLTAYSRRLLCGKYTDPDLGTITAQTFTQVLYGDSPPRISAGARYDSLVLSLYANYAFGPGAEKNQLYYIYQLSQPLRDSVPYFTTSSVPAEPDPIGSIDFTVLSAADTALSLHLSDSFGEKLLNDILDSTTYDHKSGKSFNEYFRGITIVADPTNNSVIGFDPGSLESVMTLYYHVDTVQGSYDFNMAYGVNFNRITTDRTGTPLEGLGDQKYTEFEPSNNWGYFQAGSELIPKIDLKPALDFFDTIPDVIINKATVEIINREVTRNDFYPSSIYFYFTDSTNRRILINTAYIGLYIDDRSALANPGFDNNLNGYSTSATQYVEDYLSHVTPYDQLLLYPVESALTQSVNQLAIAPDKLKLKVYYTTTSK